jgi:hypothetical protein
MPSNQLIPPVDIERRIYLIRGQRVMLDRNLAELYGVTTAALNQAVRRNLDRFPEDFMFQLDQEEFENWRSQIVISNPGLRMGARRRPLAFTEQGVAMLSSVLRSKRAIQVNIAIMRAFVAFRKLLGTHKDLAEKLADLERKYDDKFRVVFDAIRQLMAQPTLDQQRRRIGFASNNEDPSSR